MSPCCHWDLEYGWESSNNGFIIWIPTPEEQNAERSYLAFDEDSDIVARLVTMARGSFAKGHGMQAVMFYVQDGQITRLNGGSGHRSNNQLGGWVWQEYTFAIAVLEASFDDFNSLVGVGVQGGSSGGASGPMPAPKMAVAASATYPGTIRSGRDYLLHVEGDRQFQAVPTMTVEEFAKRNKAGCFRVVTIRVF